MLKKIEFYSYYSFLFWLIPGMEKIKEINLEQYNPQEKKLNFSTTVTDGQVLLIDKATALIIRYIPILIILSLFDSFNISFKIEFLFTFITACFFTIIIKSLNNYRKYLLYYILFSIFILIPFSSYLIYEFDLKYFLYILLSVFKMFISTYAAFTIVEDFRNHKKYNYYIFKEGKLIFKVEK